MGDFKSLISTLKAKARAKAESILRLRSKKR